VAQAALDELWRTRSGTLSTQVLSEFYVVATRTFDPPMPRAAARRIVGAYGYELEEASRAEKDTRLGAKNRHLGHRRDPSYPLIEWGWNRARCLEFIAEVTGASWVKSACT